LCIFILWLLLLRRSSSVALILRVAFLEGRRDAQNDETTSIISPRVHLNVQARRPEKSFFCCQHLSREK
jgi:hypothetical protein